MKSLLISILLLTTFKSYAWEAPEILANACYTDCTEKMENMYEKFMSTPSAPKFIPGMYSGECNHMADNLDPDTTHYIGLLFNEGPKGPYMAPVLQFFGEENSMADWSFEEAKKEMSPDWIEAGRLTFHPTSVTAHVENERGYPALVYWARQNLETKEIYFLAWLANYSYAFCTLKPNVNGLP